MPGDLTRPTRRRVLIVGLEASGQAQVARHELAATVADLNETYYGRLEIALDAPPPDGWTRADVSRASLLINLGGPVVDRSKLVGADVVEIATLSGFVSPRTPLANEDLHKLNNYWLKHVVAMLTNVAEEWSSSPSGEILDVVHQAELGMQIEAFILLWQAAVPSLELNSDDRRIAASLIQTVDDLSKVDDPPRDILRSAFRWFADKVDVFSTEFAKSSGAVAGKATAAGVVGAAGILAAKRLPELGDAIQRILSLLR